jgi:hypothetical protein
LTATGTKVEFVSICNPTPEEINVQEFVSKHLKLAIKISNERENLEKFYKFPEHIKLCS